MNDKNSYIQTITTLINSRNRCDQAILRLLCLIINDPEMLNPDHEEQAHPHHGPDGPIPHAVRRAPVPEETHVPKPSPGPGFNGMMLWKAAEKLLKLEGRAMGVTDMVEALRRGGLDHKSKNLYSNLASAMKAKPDKFKCISKSVFDLNFEVDRTLNPSS